VTLHVNSDPEGGDVVVITGNAAVARGQRPSALEGYVDKYDASITGSLGTTVDEIDRTDDAEIRIRGSADRSRLLVLGGFAAESATRLSPALGAFGAGPLGPRPRLSARPPRPTRVRLTDTSA
jgi:hypothetical protein